MNMNQEELIKEELIKKDFFKNIKEFVNEIDLTMDYLDKNSVPSIKKYINEIENDNMLFNAFIEYTTSHLKIYEVQISVILFSNKKIKSDYYNFMNGISLFNNILNFRVFENESKNTKKDLIKYLYSIYMSCVFLSTSNETTGSLNHKLEEFVNTIQLKADTTDTTDTTDIKTMNKNRRNAMVIDDKMSNMIQSMQKNNNTPNLGDFSGIMESILGNKDILNIANDISQKMQSQQLNPMTMIASLMSGNITDSPLQSLVEEIQQKVESKINNGEIDKNQLEDQAKNIMNSIGNNPSILNNMNGMEEMIKNMMN